MKTQITLNVKSMKTGQGMNRMNRLRLLGVLMILQFMLLSVTSTYAQERTRKIDRTELQKRKAEGKIVKGTVKFKNTGLASASIFLKGTNKGSNTDSRGNFSFPLELIEGDILVFEYLGFEKVEVKITSETTFLTIAMKEAKEILETVVLGESGSKKLFKSKRKKKNKKE